ncbi:MAG TPA: carbon starvation protein A [Victivallales bacterium]|nr:carbon starvation protein A [Victivallales bacterium]
MNGTLLLIIGIVIFSSAYIFYGRYLSRLFDVNPNRKTPAHKFSDGLDYVPTKTSVLFGHHFSSIAGAGPIVGPILALYMGWVPAVLWILIGCVFIGAMHDFAALFISIRNDGRSIGYAVESYLGYSGRQIFLLFAWAALLLVVAIFSILIAKIFLKNPSVATSSILFIFMSPFFGYLVYKKGISILVGSIIFVPLLFFFVWVGVLFPLNLTVIFRITPESTFQIWISVLLIYVFFASILPVWLLLQPRDYLNSYLLYVMLIISFLCIFFTAPSFNLPAFASFSKYTLTDKVNLLPILFVTVACGACSGFHALVSSGTTSKQIDNERKILPVSYGSMLVEGILALIAVISVAVLSKKGFHNILSTTSPVTAFSNGLAGIISEVGISYNLAGTFISLAVSAFMLTTLDTSTRLARFIWQELFIPSANSNKKSGKTGKFFKNYTVATLIVIIISGYLAFSGNGNKIWPVFGASNQLLASLTLLVISLYLIRKKVNFWIALIPMFFMLIISCWALVLLFIKNFHGNPALLISIGFLIIMAGCLVIKATFSLKQKGN